MYVGGEGHGLSFGGDGVVTTGGIAEGVSFRRGRLGGDIGGVGTTVGCIYAKGAFIMGRDTTGGIGFSTYRDETTGV